MKPQFGKLTTAYEAARIGYPATVYQQLSRQISACGSLLDIGCGTGISTRELKGYFPRVIGVDNDREMLGAAARHEKIDQTYVQASADALPFPDGTFDAITAFSAFHWFCDTKSVEEIKRVLKPSGVFVVINKVDRNDLRKIFEEVLQRFDINPEQSIKNGSYNPEAILIEHGFTEVTKMVFQTQEMYSLTGVLELVQSWNAWSYVAPQHQATALAEMKRRYEALAQNNIIVRKVDIVLTTGKK